MHYSDIVVELAGRRFVRRRSGRYFGGIARGIEVTKDTVTLESPICYRRDSGEKGWVKYERPFALDLPKRLVRALLAHKKNGDKIRIRTPDGDWISIYPKPKGDPLA